MPRAKRHAGEDQGNLGDNTIGKGEDDQQLDFVSYRDLFNVLNMELNEAGYQLCATPNGSFCGFDVYFKSELDVSGLTPPSDFRYFKKVNGNHQADTLKFLNTVKSICTAAAEASGSKTAFQMWQDIYRSFSDESQDPRSRMAKISVGMIGSFDRIGTLTGRSGAYKVLPPIDWFPAKLQDYDPSELLTLFPPAEKEMLMLILGRLMVGAKNTKTLEGDIKHTSRAYALIVGREAGMGKSTLMHYLTDAIQQLGYTTTQINPNLTRFGWGEVACSDLSTLDDLVDDKQKELIGHIAVKSIVSNDNLKVEEKGLQAVEVRAVSVLVCATNNSNYSHYIGMDSGSLNRLNQLDTYTTDELKKVYGTDQDYRIQFVWERASQRFGCSLELLMMRLLRHCADKFLEVTGHEFAHHGGITYSDDRLEDVTKALRSQYRIDIGLHHSEEIVNSIGHLVALSVAQLPEAKRASYIEHLQNLDMSPELLLASLRVFTATEPLPLAFDDISLKHLTYTAKKYLRSKFADFERSYSTQSLDKAFSNIVGELKSNKGFGYPNKTTSYQQTWMNFRRNIDVQVAKYVEVLKTQEVERGTILDVIMAELRKYILDTMC